MDNVYDLEGGFGAWAKRPALHHRIASHHRPGRYTGWPTFTQGVGDGLKGGEQFGIRFGVDWQIRGEATIVTARAGLIQIHWP